MKATKRRVGTHTGNAGSVVQVLTRQVEVELLKSELRLANNELASIGGDDLDSSTQVLELSALRHVRYFQRDVGGRDKVEDTVDHVDRRLPSTGGTETVGTGVERRPIQRTLPRNGQPDCSFSSLSGSGARVSYDCSCIAEGVHLDCLPFLSTRSQVCAIST